MKYTTSSLYDDTTIKCHPYRFLSSYRQKDANFLVTHLIIVNRVYPTGKKNQIEERHLRKFLNP